MKHGGDEGGYVGHDDRPGVGVRGRDGAERTAWERTHTGIRIKQNGNSQFKKKRVKRRQSVGVRPGYLLYQKIKWQPF